MPDALTSSGVDRIVSKESPINSIYEVIDTVREMPGLVIGSPSLSVLHGFLLGFESSCHAFQNPLNVSAPDFSGFSSFVARHLGRPASELNWRNLLLEAHGDESAAFNAFFELLDAFRGEAR